MKFKNEKDKTLLAEWDLKSKNLPVKIFVPFGYYDDYYAKAAKVRTLIRGDFEKAFEKCDVIVGPVSPTTAWDLGAKTDNPLAMYLSDVYTIVANLAGIPGLSVPCGFSEGLPVGLQILGKQWDEQTILKVGYAYEQATEWYKEKPKL